MKNAKHPEMPDCKPFPMKFKDVPTVNAEGTPLGLCEKCQGSGKVCTAEKTSINKLGASVTEKLPKFAGSLRRQRERGGVYSFQPHVHRLQGRWTSAQGECQ